MALDRATRLAQRRTRPADISRWTIERDAIYNQIMQRRWNPKVGAFTQHYDTEVLDSSLLMMPLQGFIAPRDPMWLSTLEAMDRELISDSLVYRYNPAASPDGLGGDEGTFSLCLPIVISSTEICDEHHRNPRPRSQIMPSGRCDLQVVDSPMKQQ